PEFISGASKHNLLCSLEHEFSFRQIVFDPPASFFGFGKAPQRCPFRFRCKVTAVYTTVK
ncbi:hypothetical protein, partial [Bacteroides sp.]|uniref:hypothetical protein n=1 Tax=Bacteroides sp. TaxID=29523 RepID=UPI003A924BC5